MTDISEVFYKLCTPAQIYLFLALLSCFFALFNNMKLWTIFFKLLFSFLWTLFLSYICSVGYSGLAWFLVLFPYIIIFFVMIGLLTMVKK